MGIPSGSVVLVTGASSGIGAATAKAAARGGLRVALVARRKDRLAALVEELGADRALALEADVAQPDAAPRAVAATLEAASMTPLSPEDVAHAVLYAIAQPAHVAINQVLLRPRQQAV